MAITATWSINNMTHRELDGGVFIVSWSLFATDGAYNASGGGKINVTPDTSASDYIAYADLTEANVLGWVYNSIRKHYYEDDADGNETTVYTETAAEAKARIEAERTAKVQGQIDRATANSTGVPWAAE